MNDSIKCAIFSILDNIILDSDVRSIVENPPYFPFYAQIVSKCRNGIFPVSTDISKTKSGLVKWNPYHTTDHLNTLKYTKLEVLKSREFQNLTEFILEATIYNLMQEANAGEFDLTKYQMLFKI